MIKDFNFKFSIELRWPITFRKNDEEDQPHIVVNPTKPPRVLEMQVSSTPNGDPICGVTTTEQIKINSDGVRLTKRSNYTKPDERYRTALNDRPKSTVSHRGSVNYFKTIQLKHEGMSEQQIAARLNISRSRVNQLLSEYIKSNPTHNTLYSKQAFERSSPSTQKRITTEYNKEFITDVLRKILVKRSNGTPWIELHKEFNVPSSTLRGWVKRYAINR